MKKFLSILLVLIMALSLVACGSGNNTDTTSPSPSPSTNTTEPDVDEPSTTPSNASSGDSDLEYIKGKGEMVIGYTDYEPMNYVGADGKLTGFDTEFAEAVCEKLGVTPNFVEITWDTKVIELDAKSIDCIWNGMTISDDLKQQIDTSTPYVKNMQVIVINSANADTYVDTASLADKTLVCEAGSAGETVISEDENLQNATCVTVTKQTDSLLEVKAGTADAAVLDWTLAKTMIGEGTDYADLVMIPNVELSVEEYGIGFRKNSDLCTEVNKIIDELAADGTLKTLADKYGLSLAPALDK